jgi:hypothetical protein
VRRTRSRTSRAGTSSSVVCSVSVTPAGRCFRLPRFVPSSPSFLLFLCLSSTLTSVSTPYSVLSFLCTSLVHIQDVASLVNTPRFPSSLLPFLASRSRSFTRNASLARSVSGARGRERRARDLLRRCARLSRKRGKGKFASAKKSLLFFSGVGGRVARTLSRGGRCRCGNGRSSGNRGCSSVR